MTEDNNQNQVEDAKAKKPKKKKGPIRFEAIIPLVLVLVLISLYSMFFLDSHLRRAIELGALYAHRAEVNIKSLNLSFTNASLVMTGLQVTNYDKPEENLVEIGRISFDLSWDALLRAKFVVDNSEITSIQINSKRKRPGRILEKTKSAEKVGTQLSNVALDAAKDEYEGNILGDTATVLSGAKPEDQLKKIEGDLKASGKLKEIEKALKDKEKEWQKRLATLPKDSDLKALETKFKSIKTSNFKNPAEVQKSVKAFEQVFKEADTKLKEVKTAGSDLDKDIKTYKGAFNELEQMVQKDIKDLEKRLNIPKLDAQNISKMLFGKIIIDKLGKYSKWINMAREYMPPKKSADEKAAKKEEAITPKERALGRNYTFPKAKSYPLFWLKKAKISSKSSDAEFSGDLEGELVHVTSNPVLLGKPTVLNLKGDFPKQKIFGMEAKVTIDHTTEKPIETLDLVLGRVPVEKMMLSDSEDVSFGFNSAQTRTVAKATMQGQEINLNATTLFTQLDYVNKAKSPILNEVLAGVAKDLNKFDLVTKVTGSFSKFNLGLKSGLGQALQNSLKKQLDQQIQKARKQIKEMVDSKIKGEKDKLQSQINQFEKKLGAPINNAKGKIEGTKKNIEDSKKKAVNSEKKKIENKAKDLLKGIKF